MSRVLPLEKAFEAVRKCCYESMPGPGKALRAVENAIKNLSPAMEALAVSPIRLPKPGVSLGRVSSKGLVVFGVPIPGSDLLPEVVAKLEAVRKDLSRLDPCEQLLGCVAEEFRKLQLPQGKSAPSDRIRYVDLDWARTFFAEQPQRIPRRRQRLVRQEK